MAAWSHGTPRSLADDLLARVRERKRLDARKLHLPGPAALEHTLRLIPRSRDSGEAADHRY